MFWFSSCLGNCFSRVGRAVARHGLFWNKRCGFTTCWWGCRRARCRSTVGADAYAVTGPVQEWACSAKCY